MLNSELVTLAYNRHHAWLSQVAYNFTKNKIGAEDLVQDLYLKLMEMTDCNKIIYKNDVNLFYLYKMLKSAFINSNKRQTILLPIDDDLLEIIADEYSYGADNDFERMLTLTHEALDKEYWFGKELLRIYIEENHSIQSLHNATGISNSTIWTQLNKTKKYVREYVSKNM